MIFDPENTRVRSLGVALRNLGCAAFGHAPKCYRWSPHVLACRRCHSTLAFGAELTDDWPQSMRDSYLGGRRALKREREANAAASRMEAQRGETENTDSTAEGGDSLTAESGDAHD